MIKNKAIKVKISKELLEDWKILMAVEVVRLFKEESSKNVLETASFLKTENAYYKDFFSKQKKILNEQVLFLQQKYSSAREIEIFKTKLEIFYFNTLSTQLQIEAQQLIEKETDRIKTIILNVTQKSTPTEILHWLKKSVTYFIGKKNEQDRLRIQCKHREDSTLNSYLALSRSHRAKQNIEARWNALKTMYVALLEVEEHEIRSQIYSNCIQLCQTYSSYSKSSKELLNNIESSLKEKAKLQITSIPVFTYLGKIDTNRQKQLLELWIGHNINHWGNAPVSWRQIEKQLLINLNPVVESVFEEFSNRFILEIG